MKTIRRIVAALRPSGPELEQLVHAEMDPARYAAIRPIAAGPLVAIAGLLVVGILGIASAPFRIVKNFRSP